MKHLGATTPPSPRLPSASRRPLPSASRRLPLPSICPSTSLPLPTDAPPREAGAHCLGRSSRLSIPACCSKLIALFFRLMRMCSMAAPRPSPAILHWTTRWAPSIILTHPVAGSMGWNLTQHAGDRFPPAGNPQQEISAVSGVSPAGIPQQEISSVSGVSPAGIPQQGGMVCPAFSTLPPAPLSRLSPTSSPSRTSLHFSLPPLAHLISSQPLSPPTGARCPALLLALPQCLGSPPAQQHRVQHEKPRTPLPDLHVTPLLLWGR